MSGSNRGDKIKIDGIFDAERRCDDDNGKIIGSWLKTVLVFYLKVEHPYQYQVCDNIHRKMIPVSQIHFTTFNFLSEAASILSVVVHSSM